MPELKRWSGNMTTNISIYDNELDELARFVAEHKENYIFGDGYIGQSLSHYCTQAELSIDGLVTSKTIGSIENKKDCGIIIGVGDGWIQEIVPVLRTFFRADQIFTLSSEKRNSIGASFNYKKIRDNFWINIFVTNACNLFCKSCSTFSPVCHGNYYSFESFVRDMKCVSELGFPSLSVLKFTGGEALLHPNIMRFFSFARKLFPETPFECYTNGILLLRLDDQKLRQLREYGIILVITEYPAQKVDYSAIYRRLDAGGISYEVIFSEGQKFFSKRPINFKKNTPKYLFYQCPRYKMCDSVFLFEGRFYKCVYALSSLFFNEAFKTKLELESEDYLNIYNIGIEDVYEYCRTRIPFCGYCSPIEELVEWGFSSRRIEEWT